MLDINPTELPPFDEKGQPKYKGKKRGRKPKVRKRKLKVDRPKRQHTGYTLFMQETYPNVKIENPDQLPKALIGLVAKLWNNLTTGGKTEWKERAESTNKKDSKDEKMLETDSARYKSFHQSTIDGDIAEDRDANKNDQDDGSTKHEADPEQHQEENYGENADI
mmetsp:Transcript_7524/g.16217  ORF Transcript_7524/g.16217 Transcript_7524/m.16217 type:complete len:164 (-) Transcript_7524:1718-2209(-)